MITALLPSILGHYCDSIKNQLCHWLPHSTICRSEPIICSYFKKPVKGVKQAIKLNRQFIYKEQEYHYSTFINFQSFFFS